ncbi:clathrin heavy chain protein [Perkinsela sp. CCAP 1560/4]|nr:clathrin heavy chain protein [Perkinsela sp. CCAP 1560/4]|eukprot:KNH08069.1 clathrin heavy chain protein [Perkinsela sp. CCAP 1560/4]
MEKPILVQELFNLKKVSGGLHPDTLSFRNIDMHGDRTITLRDTANGSGSLVIVNVNDFTDMRLPMKDVDSAKMNPKARILALRSNLQIQIYNLDLKTRIQTTNLSEPVAHWGWVDGKTLAIVSATSVYHWNIEQDNGPVKAFDRDPRLADLPIFSYTLDESTQCGALSGLTRGAGGGLGGFIQFYSFPKRSSLVVRGLQSCFLRASQPDGVAVVVFSKEGKNGKLISQRLTGQGSLETQEIWTSPVELHDAEDFPVAMCLSPKYTLLCMISRNGYFYLADVATGKLLLTNKVSEHIVYSAVPNAEGGLTCVDASGSLFSIGINDNTIVKFIQSNPENSSVEIAVAPQASPSGGDISMKDKLKSLLNAARVDEAVRCVLESPRQELRTQETVQLFTDCGHANPTIQPPPISTYYKQLLAIGKLNAVESFAFGKAVVARGGIQMLRKLVDDNKLELSADLGHAIAPHDEDLALRVLHRTNEHEEVVKLLLSRGSLDKVTAYCDRAKFQPEWNVLLRDCMRKKLDVSVQVAIMLHRLPDKGGFEPLELVNLFLSFQCIKQLTMYLIEILRGDREEDSELHTRLLEINLKHSPPKVAEQIFLQKVVSHYDALTIAPLCEKASLYRWALHCYAKAHRGNQQQLKEMKRCMRSLSDHGSDWLVEFFGKLSREDGLELFEELVASDPEGNCHVSVEIAAKYHGIFGILPIVNIFLKHSAFKAIYYFLSSVKDVSKDPEVHFRYIEAAIHEDEITELDRFTRETEIYDPVRTKALLLESSLEDPRPLMNVCDKYNYVEEMIKHFIQSKHFKFVELYVQKYRPNRMPEVVGILLDFNCDEELVKNLIESVGSMCASEELIAEVEKRNRVHMLQGWLENKLKEKSKEAAVHNALAKIYVNQGKALEFLSQNEYYDPLVIGNYCAHREPNIAFQAYSKGKCDEELIKLSFDNGFFKQLAVYLVQRQKFDLWEKVFERENRNPIIDAVIHHALPGSKNPEEVSVTVKAFMKAGLQEELTVLLEKIVMHGPKEFRQNKYLQNLLILTTIKTKNEKAIEYIEQLNSFDTKEIARAALANEQFEVAFAAWCKGDMEEEAMRVLTDKIGSLERSQAFAEKINTPSLWSILGEAYLSRNAIGAGVDALIRAENTDFLSQVAESAEEFNDYQHLVKYIGMIRSTGSSLTPKLETEILYSLAKIGNLVELRKFIDSSKIADFEAVASRCRGEKLYEAACVLFQHCNDMNALSLTYAEMGNIVRAVESAEKANNVQLWKNLFDVCLDTKDLELANRCASRIISYADEVYSIIERYEENGLHTSIITVLQEVLGSANAHVGVFTELAILYVKYSPEKAFDFVKMHHQRINKHKLNVLCADVCMWELSCLLYQLEEDWDGAAQLMLQEPAFTWEHEMLMNILNKVSADEIIDQAIDFYFTYQPSLVNELLSSIRTHVDMERIQRNLQRNPDAFIVKPFLDAMAVKDHAKVSHLHIDLCINEKDIEKLTAIVESDGNFNVEEVGTRLKESPHRALRLLGGALMARRGQFERSVEIYMAEKLYIDVLAIAARCRNDAVIANCMDWFVQEDRRDCFAALVFASVSSFPPEIVFEKAFLYDESQLLMPHFVQTFADVRKNMAKIQNPQSKPTDRHKGNQLLLE